MHQPTAIAETRAAEPNTSTIQRLSYSHRDALLSTRRPCVARRIRGRNKRKPRREQDGEIKERQQSDRDIFLQQPARALKDPTVLFKEDDRRRGTRPRSKIEQQDAEEQKRKQVDEEQSNGDRQQATPAAQAIAKTLACVGERAGRPTPGKDGSRKWKKDSHPHQQRGDHDRVENVKQETWEFPCPRDCHGCRGNDADREQSGSGQCRQLREMRVQIPKCQYPSAPGLDGSAIVGCSSISRCPARKTGTHFLAKEVVSGALRE